MRFSTVVEIPSSPIDIDYQSKVLTLGSCFSDHIGRTLQNAYFDTFSNPFGVLYNPLSVARGLELLLGERELSSETLFWYNGLWSSFEYSSHYASPDPTVAYENMQQQLVRGREFLADTKVLFITFGTAWVYQEKVCGEVVANCHKLPADRFERYQLGVERVVEVYADLLARLHSRYPTMEVVFTVSPIRHWKDGVHSNTLSKSVLHLSVSALVERFSFVSYFPAYEIVLDELRDYRYYDADMLHPSSVAIHYIWQRFSETYFSSSTLTLQKRLEQYRKDLAHRPRQMEGEQFLKFQAYVEKKRIELLAQFPFLKNRLQCMVV